MSTTKKAKERTYIVRVEFPLADKSGLVRKIAENAPSAKAAKAKVQAHYRRRGNTFKILGVKRRGRIVH